MADVKKVSVKVKPVEVRVESGGTTFFVTIWKNGSLKIRPKGARKADAVAFTTINSTYQRALLVRAQADKPSRKRPVKRGLLSLERRGI